MVRAYDEIRIPYKTYFFSLIIISMKFNILIYILIYISLRNHKEVSQETIKIERDKIIDKNSRYWKLIES